MKLKITNLEDTITSGELFHIEIDGWNCVLGFCLNEYKEDKFVNENFKTTKLNEQNISSSGYSH